MSHRRIKNQSASVRQRLLNLAREKSEDFQTWLDRFAAERLLYRLSQSKHRGSFALKGAALFAVWSEEVYRPTRDIDLLGWGDNSQSRMRDVFRELCTAAVDDDGLVFDADSVAVREIAAHQEYGGLRVILRADLAGARAHVQVDIGFGDAITPGPVEVEYTSILGFPPAVMQAYPKESVVAEKVQAIVSLGLVNSRLKDFWDVYNLAQVTEFDGGRLCEALRATFSRRKTALPGSTPVALTDRFYDDLVKQRQWEGFKRESRVDSQAGLDEVCVLLEQFLMPPLKTSAENKTFDKIWQPGGPWC